MKSLFDDLTVDEAYSLVCSSRFRLAMFTDKRSDA
jgi:hypothetical protein